ncbi:histidine phosphatase family protein [Rhizobiaceae bacterium BDR2-2]|uniref:Histidine phosphatase family protein n=1 Tax=Ectorhizobium quercum TaxID=2965071 RepID=A0AAE3MX80_9HYPH|nr:histidine phosphatase family protein [Ectorhizobium quercum]MCX8995759.1 histidine phosphatase family protein [Ectorhizobium quercum]
MKDVFVVTHTQSVHHVENRVGGWYDTGLTEKGLRDAGAVAGRLVAMIGGGPVEIFSSDLLRATQTAEVIAGRLGQHVSRTADLREISYGAAGGKPQEWLDARQVPAPEDNRLDHRGGVDDAETRREFAARIYRGMDAILARPCETQIVVTHGFALTFVIAAWIGMPLEAVGRVSFPARSGSLTHLRQDDYWRNRAVLRLADISHLAEEE